MRTNIAYVHVHIHTHTYTYAYIQKSGFLFVNVYN